MSPHLIGWLLVPASLGGMAWELNKLRLSRATAKWKRVPCTIESIKTSEDGSGLSGEAQFKVEASYSYRVGGKQYRSTKVSNGHSEFLSHAEAAKLTAGIPEKGACFAYVNPDDPQDAVLVAGADTSIYQQLALIVGLLGLGIFLTMT